MQTSIVILEDSSAVSYKAKLSLNHIIQKLHSLGYLPKKVETLCKKKKKKMHMNVYCSFVPNCQNPIVGEAGDTWEISVPSP